MKYLRITQAGYGFVPYIAEVTDNKGENSIHEWYITVEQFRNNYKNYSNWESYADILVGKIDNDLKNKIKQIIKNQLNIGKAKMDAIISIYGLITENELPFDENVEDMKTAEILYDIISEWI